MSDSVGESNEHPPDASKLISLKEAAKISGFSFGHMRHLARNGDVWAMKLGRDWFTTEKAIRDYLARDRRPGPKPKKSQRQDT